MASLPGPFSNFNPQMKTIPPKTTTESWSHQELKAYGWTPGSRCKLAVSPRGHLSDCEPDHSWLPWTLLAATLAILLIVVVRALYKGQHTAK